MPTSGADAIHNLSEHSALAHQTAINGDVQTIIREHAATDVPYLTEQKADVLEAALNGSQSVLRSHEEQRTVEDILYPGPGRLSIIIVSLCLGSLLNTLDMTSVPIAIPKVADTFASMSDVGWYASVNMLILCSFIPIFGKIYANFDEKWTYLCMLMIFEIGSLICATARSSAVFILGRATVGLGEAGIWVGSNIIIVHSVPLQRRAFYTGLVGSMYGVSSIVGPLAGGLFSDSKRLTWRWCFYINLPICAATMLAVLLFFKSPLLGKSKKLTFREKVAMLDFWGLLFFIPGILCLLCAFQWGGVRYNWANARIIALFLVSFFSLSLFVAIQCFRRDSGTIPPRIIRQRSIYTSCLYTFCISGSFFLLVYYLPVWFAAIQQTSAFETGVRNLPLKLSVVFTTMLAGAIVSACGYYAPFMLASAALLAVASGLLTTLHRASRPSAWITYQLIAGLGQGLGQQQGLMAVQTTLVHNDVPVGVAIVLFSQLLGGAIAVAIGQGVFYNLLIRGLLPSLPDVKTLVTHTGTTKLELEIWRVNPALEGKVKGVHNHAVTSAFWISVVLAICGFLAATGVEWRTMRVKRDPASKAGSNDNT
jgi:MFS family permease